MILLPELLFVFHCAVMEEVKIHSASTGHDYVIRFATQSGFSAARAYTIAVVADGAAGAGSFLLDPVNKIHIPAQCIIVTIAHTGNRTDDRNRDFIPSDILKNGKDNYGHADKFYMFIQSELMPLVARHFPTPARKVFIGHSLSGLFCLYMLFRDPRLFDDWYAISPSVWANNYELLSMEGQFARSHRDLPAYVFIYAGSLEWFDLIRVSIYQFNKAIKKRNYPNLHLRYTIIPYKRHFTVRRPALQQIMETLKTQ